MAISTNTPARPLSGDRRAFLAAGMASVVAVSAIAPAGVQASPVSRWDSAMHRWSEARDRMEATNADADVDAFVAVQSEAMDIPSPHAHAVRWKIQRLREDATSFASEEEVYDFLIRDLNRLLGDA